MITWKAKYEIGVEKIDNEHKVFLSLIHDFDEQAKKNPNIKLLVNRAKEFKMYAEFHFFSEENLMSECNYSELPEHRQMHQKLVNDLTSLIAKLEVESVKPSEFSIFVLEWFVGHTTQEDLRIAKFINKNLT